MTTLNDAAIQRLRVAAMWPVLPGERYRDVTLLARGGMGTIYRAFDAVLARDVAIKVSNAVASASDLDARLADESRTLAALEHPGIVPVHDAGVLTDGRSFYVMRLITGPTLAAHRDTVGALGARLSLLERVADTVAFAHARGITHRDLSPSNIMMGDFGDVLVLDWGVAQRSADPDGLRVGTPGFMAPEARTGHGSGPATDIYALGQLLDWMCEGQTIDRRLRAIVTRCTETAPADRYPSVGALLHDLAAYRAGAPMTAYRESRLERAHQWMRRHQLMLWLIAAYIAMRAALIWYLRR